VASAADGAAGWELLHTIASMSLTLEVAGEQPAVDRVVIDDQAPLPDARS